LSLPNKLLSPSCRLRDELQKIEKAAPAVSTSVDYGDCSMADMKTTLKGKKETAGSSTSSKGSNNVPVVLSNTNRRNCDVPTMSHHSTTSIDDISITTSMNFSSNSSFR
jgi:hypothetical protein